MRDIISLMGRIKTPVVLAVTEFPGEIATPEEQRYHGYGKYKLNPFKFESNMLIITQIQKASKGYVYLYYFQNGSVRNTFIPETFQVEEVRNVESRVLMNQYDEYLIKNMHSSLGHSCMIGSDPEIFVVDKENKLIPAFLFLGSKKEPTLVNGKEKNRYNHPIYWDGFQAEFETEAQSCLALHSDSIQAQLNNLLTAARKYNLDAKLSTMTTVDIAPNLLAESKDEHVEFGCMPSFNVYGMQGVTKSGRDVPYRSAGGHIHFGFNYNGDKNFKMEPKRVERMVKALDAILGVACVSLFAQFDDRRRREMYGLAGEYRLPPHGLEYRTLSNAWLCHPLITNIVFDFARKVMAFGDRGLLYTWKGSEKETIRIIQECDVEAARKVLDLNKDLMIGILSAAYGKDVPGTEIKSGAPMVFDIYRNGIESAVANPTDMVNNWCLNGSGKAWLTHCDGQGKQVATAKKIIMVEKKKVN